MIELHSLIRVSGYTLIPLFEKGISNLPVTSTQHRLPFNELDPRRFEDLCLALVLPLARWNHIRHVGRVGSDLGVDIDGVETLENGTNRAWSIQCKRYFRFTARDARKAIDEALQGGTVPDVFLLVVACDVSRQAQDAFGKYAKEKGIGQPAIWTRSILEARLYERTDLLLVYFGISMFDRSRRREDTIRRNIRLKDRAWAEFVRPINKNPLQKQPYDKFSYGKFVIRSIDDSSYPSVDSSSVSISGWFVLEPYDFYHNGIEFILGMRTGLLDEEGNWCILSPDSQLKSDEHCETFWLLGRIPYRNMVDFDLRGDEYYNVPHIFCTFSDGGEPYEEFRYSLVNAPYATLMVDRQQTELDFLATHSTSN